MSNHRNLIDVIDKIIAITPESETKFLYDLEECRKKYGTSHQNFLKIIG